MAPTGTSLSTGVQWNSYMVTSLTDPGLLYVSPTGSDSNPGTFAYPLATLQTAADLALPGTVIHVAAGLYQQPSITPLTVRVTGTSSGRIQFQSDVPRGAHVTITGQYGLTDQAYTWLVYGSYIDITGFEVTGDGRAGIQSYGAYSSVQQCHVHDIPAHNSLHGGAGIDFDPSNGGVNNNTLGNLICNIGETDQGVHGIYHACGAQAPYTGWNLIQNNLVFTCSGWGIQIAHAANHATCTNNLVASTRYAGAVYLFPDNGLTCNFNLIANNIFAHNQGDRIVADVVRESSSPDGLTNCANNTYLNNCVWATGNEPTALTLYAPETAVATLIANPQWKNYQADGSGDYHLLVTSPCIDAGTATGAPLTDYDGVSRPQGNGVDIGPYESQSISSSPGGRSVNTFNTYLDPLSYRRAPSGLESDSLIGNLVLLASPGLTAGATSLPLQPPGLTVNLNLNDRITIFDGPNSEVVTVTVATDTLGVETIQCTATAAAHSAGVILASTGPMGSLADQIVNASATLENICRQSLWISTYTNETLRMPSMRASIDNQNMLIFRPRHFPVISDTGITIQMNNANPISYDATQLILDGEAEVVSVPWVVVASSQGGGGSTYSLFSQVSRTTNLWLKITYQAGWANLPGDVTEAMICLVSDLLGKRQNPLMNQSFSLEGKTMTRVSSRDIKGQGGLYARALELLSPYIVRPF